jgi:LPXTG-site transpeptidase (sortase) family protein
MSFSRVLLWAGGLLMVLAIDIVAVDGLRSWQHQVERSAASVISSAERLQALDEPTATPETGSDSAPEAAPIVAASQVDTPPDEAASTLEPAPSPTAIPPSSTPLPLATPTVAAAVAAVEPTQAPTPAPVAEEATPEEAVSYGAAVWVTIPRIKVDERVMEVGVENGEYIAPAWDVGHQEDSVNPGEPGNSVFNGHLTTINAGHVFARLRELKPGDVIYVFTKTHRLTWTVEQVYTTDNDDNSFIAPTDDTRITLYTCDGHLLPLEHDYSNRFVVVGRLEEARARSGQTATSGAENG